MDDLKIFCCQNPDCPDYGQRGLDNLRVCFRNGPDKQRRVLAWRTRGTEGTEEWEKTGR